MRGDRDEDMQLIFSGVSVDARSWRAQEASPSRRNTRSAGVVDLAVAATAELQGLASGRSHGRSAASMGHTPPAAVRAASHGDSSASLAGQSNSGYNALPPPSGSRQCTDNPRPRKPPAP